MLAIPSVLGALSVGSTALGGIYSARQATASNKRNINFQRYMAENAHQLEVKDLKAAGLNPILSATGGSGATASGGSSVPVPNPMANMPQALLVAAQARQAEAQAGKAESEKDFIDLSSGKIEPEILKIREETRKVSQEIKGMRAHVMEVISRTKNVNVDTRLKTLATALGEVDNAIYSGNYGEAIRLLEKPGLAGSAAALGFSVKGIQMILKKAHAKHVRNKPINRVFNDINKAKQARYKRNRRSKKR